MKTAYGAAQVAHTGILGKSRLKGVNVLDFSVTEMVRK